MTFREMKDSSRNLRFLEIFLRLSVLPLTIASAFTVVETKDSTDLYGKVVFTNVSGFKFLFSVNCISAPYALISATLLMSLREDKTSSTWGFFLLDQLLAYLMVTSSSSAAELLYLAHEGDREVSWSEVCSYFGNFCSKGKASLVLHFLALLCFICLSLISAFRVFRNFEPPPVSAKGEGRQGNDAH
ncbi:CASP-like protein 2D1 [Phalaenopsis equestris]|uniref:CASP-like protein 2D1 n=1 Tax=Phalaenopsis equestris TaxID=78828 RepID=UPI0009E311DE|nr:CASP-like protein 2D1 [Phalaenopsis equestris]